MFFVVLFVIAEEEKLVVIIGIKHDGTLARKCQQCSIANVLCKGKPACFATAVPVPFLGGDPGVPKKNIEFF